MFGKTQGQNETPILGYFMCKLRRKDGLQSNTQSYIQVKNKLQFTLVRKKKTNKISQCKYSILPPSQKKNNILPESDDCCFLRFACGSLLPSFNFLLPSLCLELITSTWNSFYLQRGMSWFMQTQKTVTPDLFLLKLFLICL